ncbi:MAG: M20/M25/M40 family metallo-hydrolase, partial [Pseudomonadota bacterium]
AFEVRLAEEVTRIAAARDVEIVLGPATRAAPVAMSDDVRAGLQDAAASLGLPVMAMPSGGGHDCAVFAGLGVRAGMIFIRNENGSHNPEERMTLEDFARAADLLTAWARAELFGPPLTE